MAACDMEQPSQQHQQEQDLFSPPAPPSPIPEGFMQKFRLYQTLSISLSVNAAKQRLDSFPSYAVFKVRRYFTIQWQFYMCTQDNSRCIGAQFDKDVCGCIWQKVVSVAFSDQKQ